MQESYWKSFTKFSVILCRAFSLVYNVTFSG